MTISEPSTMITDYILSLATVALAARAVASREGRRSLAVRYWALTLAATGVAALLGGTVHGFRAELGALERPLWTATLACIGVASFSFVAGAAAAFLPRHFHQPVVWALLFKQVAALVLVTVRPEFAFAVADYAMSIVIVVIVAAPHARRGLQSARWLYIAVIVSVVAGVVLAARVSPAAHFNQNDLYHLIQLLAMVALYRAARYAQMENA